MLIFFYEKYMYAYLHWLIDCTEIMPEHTSNHFFYEQIS